MKKNEVVIYPTHRFWFEDKANRKFVKRWPSVSSKREQQSSVMDNLNGVINVADYSNFFDRQKNHVSVYPKLSSAVLNRTYFYKTLNDEMLGSLGLASNGYTSNRLLGKELDKQINQMIYREISHENTKEINDGSTDKFWADLSLIDEVLTPENYLKMLSAERIMSDPKLLTGLKTKGALEEMGFVVPENATFVRKMDDGTPLYDMVSVYPNVKEGKKAPFPIYAIDDAGAIDFERIKCLDKVENFDRLVATLSNSLGIKIEKSDTLEAGESNFNVSRMRNYGRRIINYIRKHTGAKVRPLSAGVLTVSSKGTNAKQAYSLLKAVAAMTCENPISNTKKLIENSAPENLPSLEVFSKNEENIKNASACLIASQIVSMSGLEKNDAQALADMFKVEAGQSLSKLDDIKTNNWAMPLVAGYMANGASLVAGDFKIYEPEVRKNYIDNLGVVDAGSDVFASIMYGKRNFEKPLMGIYGMLNEDAVLSEEPKTVPPTDDDHKPDDDPKVDPKDDDAGTGDLDDEGEKPKEKPEEKPEIIRDWWNIDRKDYNVLLGSEPKYLVSLRKAARDLVIDAVAETATTPYMQKVFRDHLAVSLEKYCVAGGLETLDIKIEKLEKMVESKPEKQKELDDLKVSKTLVGRVCECMNLALRYASEKDINCKGSVISGLEKETSGKMTGSALFKSFLKNKVSYDIKEEGAVVGSKVESMSTVLKSSIQKPMKDEIKRLAETSETAGPVM